MFWDGKDFNKDHLVSPLPFPSPPKKDSYCPDFLTVVTPTASFYTSWKPNKVLIAFIFEVPELVPVWTESSSHFWEAWTKAEVAELLYLRYFQALFMDFAERQKGEVSWLLRVCVCGKSMNINPP